MTNALCVCQPYLLFAVRLFVRHSRRDVLLLLLQKCDSQVFSELKKDVVIVLELVLKDSSLDFATIRGLLPLMSNYQLDLLSDQVSCVHLYYQEHMSRPKGGEGASDYVSDVLGKVH